MRRAFHVAAFIEDLQDELSPPSVKQHLAALRMLFDRLVAGYGLRRPRRRRASEPVRGVALEKRERSTRWRRIPRTWLSKNPLRAGKRSAFALRLGCKNEGPLYRFKCKYGRDHKDLAPFLRRLRAETLRRGQLNLLPPKPTALWQKPPPNAPLYDLNANDSSYVLLSAPVRARHKDSRGREKGSAVDL